MKYKILCSHDVEKLEEAVVEMLNEGWKLSGGVSVTQSHCYSTDHQGYTEEHLSRVFAQAMTIGI